MTISQKFQQKWTRAFASGTLTTASTATGQCVSVFIGSEGQLIIRSVGQLEIRSVGHRTACCRAVPLMVEDFTEEPVNLPSPAPVPVMMSGIPPIGTFVASYKGPKMAAAFPGQ